MTSAQPIPLRLYLRYCPGSQKSPALVVSLLLLTLVWPSHAEEYRVQITTAKHPATIISGGQDAIEWVGDLFNNGAALLRDTAQNPQSIINIQFELLPIPGNTLGNSHFPDQSSEDYRESERFNYTLPKYNDIPNDTIGRQLLRANFANVKLVTKASGFSGVYTGWANPDNRSMILTTGAIDSTSVHEFGHLACLRHTGDPTGIMYELDIESRKKVSKNEMQALKSLSKEMGSLE